MYKIYNTKDNHIYDKKRASPCGPFGPTLFSTPPEKKPPLAPSCKKGPWKKILFSPLASLFPRLLLPHSSWCLQIFVKALGVPSGKKSSPCLECAQKKNTLLSLRFWPSRPLLEKRAPKRGFLQKKREVKPHCCRPPHFKWGFFRSSESPCSKKRGFKREVPSHSSDQACPFQVFWITPGGSPSPGVSLWVKVTLLHSSPPSRSPCFPERAFEKRALWGLCPPLRACKSSLKRGSLLFKNPPRLTGPSLPCFSS